LVYHQEVNDSSSVDYAIEGDQGLYLLEFVCVKGEVFFVKLQLPKVLRSIIYRIKMLLRALILAITKSSNHFHAEE